ncbi:extracellular solute-binding protein [Kribbella sp. NPDC050820]|uniref:ABC transporter substrate-binding protein n=1 Tax=Kribbella sp. NPDC050820 TaxID=3155408 RepID=UPI0033F231BA
MSSHSDDLTSTPGPPGEYQRRFLGAATYSRRSFIGATALLGLTACVGGNSSSAPGSAIGASSGGATALPPKDIAATLNIWGYSQAETSSWIPRTIAAMKNEYPNVKIEYTYVPSANIVQKVLGASAAGQSPDAIGPYNPSDGAKLAQAGLIASLNPYWDAFPDKDQFLDSVVWKYNEQVISVQGYVNTSALYYNKTILAKAGLSAPPATVDELTAQLAKIKTAGYQGLAIGAGKAWSSEWFFFSWCLSAGLNYGSWDKDKLTALLQRFRDWITAGYIPQDAVTWIGDTEPWNKFTAGDYAFSHAGNWRLSTAKALSFDWGVAPIPAGAGGSHSIVGGEGFSIGSKANNPALVWRFFEQGLLTKSTEQTIFRALGSLPARKDGLQGVPEANNPNVKAFAEVVANMGARPSSPLISDYLVVVGDVFNAVCSGQTSPSAGAEQIIAQCSKL